MPILSQQNPVHEDMGRPVNECGFELVLYLTVGRLQLEGTPPLPGAPGATAEVDPAGVECVVGPRGEGRGSARRAD